MGWLEDARRNLLRRGSPSFRVGVWVAGVGGGLLWIYLEEKRKPIKERVLFLPAKREVLMEPTEIERWNQRLSGGKLLSPQETATQQQQQQQPQGVEAARARALAAIEKEAQQEQAAAAAAEKQQQQQGWLPFLFGPKGAPEPEPPKQKKVPLLFDK
ncbi:hypothetical protein Emed_002512 [Eimeria media]